MTKDNGVGVGLYVSATGNPCLINGDGDILLVTWDCWHEQVAKKDNTFLATDRKIQAYRDKKEGL